MLVMLDLSSVLEVSTELSGAQPQRIIVVCSTLLSLVVCRYVQIAIAPIPTADVRCFCGKVSESRATAKPLPGLACQPTYGPGCWSYRTEDAHRRHHSSEPFRAFGRHQPPYAGGAGSYARYSISTRPCM